MRNLIVILLLFMSSVLAAQTEISKDTIMVLNGQVSKPDQYLNPVNSTSKTQPISSEYNPLSIESENKMDVKFPSIDVYLGPPLESNTFTRYPFANDYSFSSGMILSDRMWLSSNSMQYTYPTIGAIRSVGMSLNYMLTDRLSVGAGSYGAKYNLYGSSFNDVGIKGSIKFKLSDRLSINGYGQYSVFADKNHVYGPLTNMFPSTYYGGTLEYKITNNFGVEAGVIRELNPFTGKWVNKPYISPVFYSK